jgi:hypothetical protein
MRNYSDPEDDYDYSPNELSNLSMNNPLKYREVVQSNLDPDDTLENWQQRNLEHMKKFLK